MRNLLNFLKSFRLYFQINRDGIDRSIKFNWNRRSLFFFHDYMGWHNLSENIGVNTAMIWRIVRGTGAYSLKVVTVRHIRTVFIVAISLVFL